jgi:hypothetical protein
MMGRHFNVGPHPVELFLAFRLNLRDRSLKCEA